MSSKNITHTELLIIGAGPAGVSTANFFARLNRPHVMYDSGLYRNAQSPAAHTIINYDGKNPAVWRQEGVAELLAKYGKGSSLGSNSSVDNDAKTSMGTLDYRRDTIVKLERQASVFDSWPGFSATDSSGNIVLARLQEAWGTRAIHCIFCHGTETANQPFAFLFNPGNPFNPMAAQAAIKLWYGLNHTERYVLTNGADVETEEGLKASGLGGVIGLMKAKNYHIITSPVNSIISHPTHLTVEFKPESGSGSATHTHPPLDIPHLLVMPDRTTPSEHTSPLLTPDFLGGASLSPFGTLPLFEKDGVPAGMPMPRMGDNPKTPIPGLFWAGNAGSMMANVGMSVAQGMNAGSMAGDELGSEDMERMLKEVGEGEKVKSGVARGNEGVMQNR